MPEIGVAFDDSRLSMTHWYPRIEPLDVPTLETHLIELDDPTSVLELAMNGAGLDETVDSVAEAMQELPIEAIIEAVEALPTERAHLRSDYKSSALANEDGITTTADLKDIHLNLFHLADAMLMQDFPLDALCVRECLDLYTVFEDDPYTVYPEIRFIVDEGEVLGWFVDVYEDDFPLDYRDPDDEEMSELEALLVGGDEEFDAAASEPSEHEGEYTEYIQTIRELAEEDEDELTTWAQQVADEFDDTGWSVDFVMDDDGDWHLTDMALYGLYWNEQLEEWTNISHIRSGEPYNLEENPPSDLPAEPTDDMVRVDR